MGKPYNNDKPRTTPLGEDLGADNLVNNLTDKKEPKGSNSRRRMNSGNNRYDKKNGQSSPWIATRIGDIKYVSSLIYKLTPTQNAIAAPTFYNILSKANSMVTAKFFGEANETGNILGRLLTLNRSTFNDYYDSLSFPLEMRYSFLAYSNTDVGIAINEHYNQAVVEALANTHSTILTELLFSKSTGTSSMPNMSDSRVGALVHYQTMLQNLALIMIKYNQLMSLTDEMIKMGINAESPNTTELIALLKKSSMVAKLKAISKGLISKFFDLEWYNNFSRLTDVPTRKADSIREPLMTTKPYYVIPDATLSDNGVAWYDSSQFRANATTRELFNGGDNYTYVGQDLAFYTQQLVELFDQQTVLKFCRRLYKDTLQTADQKKSFGLVTVTTYFNNVVAYLSAVQEIFNKFTAAATDIEVFLDRAAQANLMQWQKGTVFTPESIASPVKYNTIVNDVLSAYLTTPNKIVWNSVTQQWTYSVLWDEHTDVPKYDMYQGGAYLTFSVRDVDIASMDVNDPAIMIPKLFNVNKNPVCVNRSGNQIELNGVVISPAQLKNDPVLSRIIPFQDLTNRDIFSMRIATVVGDVSSAQDYSTVVHLLTNQFMVGQMTWQSGKKSLNSRFIKTSAMSLIDAQMESLGTDMLIYVRTNAPLRVWTEKTRPIFGVNASLRDKPDDSVLDGNSLN